MKCRFRYQAAAGLILTQIFIVFIVLTIISTAWADSPVGAPNKTASVNDLFADFKAELGQFQIAVQKAGYMDVDAFLHFLDRAGGAAETDKSSFIHRFLSDPLSFKGQYGLLPVLICILIGGIVLNLTPCVLPMIPVNLAIIGIGGKSDRVRGFAMGSAYGVGMTLAYGYLGAVVVATGSHFGSIQSSWWFNILVAAVFLILGLAMFDIVRIDLTSLQTRLKGGPKVGKGVLMVAAMGAVSALLAGACVAPVVIAVLLLAAGMGTPGLLLPFVLGLGMALPWPLAGSGLAVLPKPGQWMVYLKYGFGIIIIGFSIHYGWLAYRQFTFVSSAQTPGVQESGHMMIAGDDLPGLTEAFYQARLEKKPVLLDFRADWCKNCKAMEKKTFVNPAVLERLEKYMVIKYSCDRISDASTKLVTDHFGIRGLPTLVVLKPNENT